jgi:hypothetical protein
MLKKCFGNTMLTFAAPLSEKDILNCTDDVQDEEPTPEPEVFLPMKNERVCARVLCCVHGDNQPIDI